MSRTKTRSKRVEDYLRADRQWRREERLAHIKYQLEQALTPVERTFWNAVREANEDHSSAKK